MTTQKSPDAVLGEIKKVIRQVAELQSSATGSDPAERVVDVMPLETGRWRVTIASDGLELKQKIAVERQLHQALVGFLPPEASLVVNFKRQKAEPPSARAGGPVPMARPAPFGLTIDRRAIPGVRHVIAIASGKGGVGKSTVTANLAVALARRGQRVGLLDADIYGPSAPLMLGLKGPMPVAPGNRIVPLEGHGVKAVSFGFLTDTESPVMWRGPVVSKALRQLCFDVAWGELDHLLIDLPPGTGDVQLTLIESIPIHSALIVTTPQDVALIDAHKALTMFNKLEVPVIGVIENMAQFICSNCGHVEHVFGEGGVDEFAKARNIPKVTRLPLEGRIRAAGDGGRPAVLEAGSISAAVFDELAGLVMAR